MNEPIFTLETTPDGSRRRLADPWTARPVRTPDARAPRRPLPVRLLAGIIGIAGTTSRRLFPARP